MNEHQKTSVAVGNHLIYTAGLTKYNKIVDLEGSSYLFMALHLDKSN